jgi:uncharacterized membrane protein
MGPDQKPSIDREDIQIVARHSTITKEGIAKALQEFVYSSPASWRLFLRLFLLALGVSFILAGIIFFFAYNWADLNKFAKIGIVQGLIILTALLAMVPRFSLTVRNILLTGASILVGVLFAVFGQIYQTGANAYDFFLAWTICITIWVLISDFAPLWAIYLALINITIALYSAQVANVWEGVPMITALTILNAMVLVGSIFLSGKSSDLKIPTWFTNTVALVVIYLATTGMMIIIFDRSEPVFLSHIIVTSILYAAGYWYGLHYRRAFYLSIIPFSLIIIISAFLIKTSDGAAMFLATSLFVIASVSFLIMQLIRIQKKWTIETGK